MSRRETVTVWVVAILIVSGWMWLTASQGALGIARNDDWSYLRNAFALADTGNLQVTGWVQMTLIGQLLLAWPVIAVVGPSVTALQILVACFGVVLIVTSYALARLLAPIWIAVMSAAVVALGPLLGTLSVSFMTDVPAAALQLLTLWLGVRGLQRGDGRWLVAAGATGLLAFSIREYSVVALAAVWLVAVVQGAGPARRVSRRFLSGWTLGLALIGLGIVWWRAGQVTTTVNPLAFNTQGLFSAAALPLTIGLLCLPAAACINPWAAIRRAWGGARWLVVLVAAGLLLALYVSRGGVLGNYVTAEGAYPQALRGVATSIVPGWLWSVSLVLALLSVIALLAVTVTAVSTSEVASSRRLPPIRNRAAAQPAVAIAVLFLILTLLLFLILPSVAQTALYDRYLLAFAPVAAALALRSARFQGTCWSLRAWPIVGAQLTVFSLMSVAIVGGTAASDGARWEVAAQIAQRDGLAPGNIDGGFDWFGFHPSGVPMPNPALAHWTWWTTRADDRAVCVSITFEDPGTSTQAWGPDAQTPVRTRIDIQGPLWQERSLLAFVGPDDCRMSVQ